MSAVIYVRVSSAEQTLGTSLDTQLERCREWCQRNRHEVMAEFREEGESAKTQKRPEFLRALEFCRKKKPGVFLVWKVDRLSRSQLDFHNIRALLAGFGTRVQSATETLTDDPSGKLMEGILAAFAQFDNELRSERTRAGMLAVARSGGWVWRAPVGYVNARTADGKASLVVDPVMGALVKRGFELIANAETPAAVLRTVTRLGLRALNGRPMLIQDWMKLLRARVYVAQISTPFVAPERIAGNWPALISHELFAYVQTAIHAEPGRHYIAQREEFPLRRFAKCGLCDGALTASWSTGRDRRRYAYYRCYRCSRLNVPAAILHEAFLRFMDGYRFDPECLALAMESLKKMVCARRDSGVELRREADSRIAALRVRREKLLDLLERGTINDDDYARRRDAIDCEIAAASAEKHEKALSDTEATARLEVLTEVLSAPARVWQFAGLEGKTALQREFYPQGVTVTREGRFWKIATAECAPSIVFLRGICASGAGMVPRKGVEPLSLD